MARSRLLAALADGALVLPAGPVVVLRPPIAADLSPISPDSLHLLHGSAVEAAWWLAAGMRVNAPLPANITVAMVCLPRSRELGRALVAQAAALAPLVLVDGQKTDGIDAIWREMRERLGQDLPGLTAAHGRLFWCRPGTALADWAAPGPRQGPDGFWRQPGVFSQDGADPGSVALAAALPAQLPPRMADLGAGWGYLSAAVLARSGPVSLDLIEAEALALDCARLAITDPRARFHWADATAFTPDRPYDGIVMNPPFHAGRAADPGLGRAFISAAARMLSRDGRLWMVANRHLPYETALTEAFLDLAELPCDSPGFKILRAGRPRAAAKATAPVRRVIRAR